MTCMETEQTEAPGLTPAPLPRRNPSWRTEFLTMYERTGQLYLCVKAVGVSWDKFERECTKDPRFKQAVDVRRQRYADRLEGQFDNMFFHPTRPNVIAGIVLAKKHRPQDFVERHQGVTMNVQALATPEQAHELLRVMLRDATPETQAQLALPPPEAT